MAETTTNDRYMEGEGVGFDYAPSFTKGYPLPDGWQWVCFDDGSGSLDAPDGTSYFSYDLATGEMRDTSSYLGSILDREDIKMRLGALVNMPTALSCEKVHGAVSLSEEARLSRQASEQLSSDRHGTDAPTLDSSERD